LDWNSNERKSKDTQPKEQPLKKKPLARIKASRHPNKKKTRVYRQLEDGTYFPQVFVVGGKQT